MENAVGLLHESDTVVFHKPCDKVGMSLIKMDSDNGPHNFAPVHDDLVVPRKSGGGPRHGEGHLTVLIQQPTKGGFKLI